MICVYVEAPFAAFRTFSAGWFRPTATFMTPSAAYGLLLNVAGIESRLREGDVGHDGRAPTTYTRPNLPRCRIALGLPGDEFPQMQSLFQQLHNYPVGQSGKGRAEECRASKYNITPIRREFLSDLRALVALDASSDFEEAIRRGLTGEGAQDRYGVPFVGDNAFLLDRLEEVEWPSDRFPNARWYERIGSEERRPRSRATRLTILIDRADISRTRSDLYAPSERVSTVPDSAWTEIQPPTERPSNPPKRKKGS